LPQPPQLPALPVVSTQLEPHNAKPPPHPVEHLPCEHTMPAAQTVPHAPQFFASEVMETHVPLQLTCPAGHPHMPFTQACPAAHGCPQVPQLATSLARL
jgi:hypothetical protein